MKNELAIGIDLGGTKIKAVLLKNDGDILQQTIRDTQDKEGNLDTLWKEEIAQIIEEWSANQVESLKIGLSAPGLPNETHHWIEFMPGRLQGLENLKWSSFLNVPEVLVINDAKAALLAEYHFGAGQNHQNITLLTLGTGVGGALLLNGKLHTGWLNRAGHMGHMSLHPFGKGGIVKLPGTLEMAIGNSTVEERTKGKYKNTASLVEAYKIGEPIASLVWLESVKNLAIGLSSIINITAPELIILSGGITKANEALFEPLASFMEQYEWRPGNKPTAIVKAKFEGFAGAVGAACFALFGK